MLVEYNPCEQPIDPEEGRATCHSMLRPGQFKAMAKLDGHDYQRTAVAVGHHMQILAHHRKHGGTDRRQRGPNIFLRYRPLGQIDLVVDDEVQRGGQITSRLDRGRRISRKVWLRQLDQPPRTPARSSRTQFA